MKIFFSWQSDVKKNKNFILNCLKKAIKEVKEFEIDTATRDSKGSVDIADSILEKIEDADLLIADISIINHDDKKNRKCPNPNVMYELGYAAKTLGWERIIQIANKDITDNDKLPFDIRNKRMIIKKFDNITEDSITKDIISCMKNHLPKDNQESPPKISLEDNNLSWASNYSGYGASFRGIIKIDNYSGDENYIIGVKITASDADGNYWETSIFIFMDQKKNTPFKIKANEMCEATVFLVKDPDNGKMPDLDIDTIRLKISFRSGKETDIKARINKE